MKKKEQTLNKRDNAVESYYKFDYEFDRTEAINDSVYYLYQKVLSMRRIARCDADLTFEEHFTKDFKFDSVQAEKEYEHYKTQEETYTELARELSKIIAKKNFYMN